MSLTVQAAFYAVVRQLALHCYCRRAVEIHLDTWFCYGACQQLVSTTRGTRPGDPWGIFARNAFMVEVLIGIEQRLDAEGLLMHVLEPTCALSTNVKALASDIPFVDDVAVLALAASPELLDGTVEVIAGGVTE